MLWGIFCFAMLLFMIKLEEGNDGKNQDEFYFLMEEFIDEKE